MKRVFSSLIALSASLLILSGCASHYPATDMNPEEFSTAIRSSEEVQILDVRTPQEYEEGHIAGALNINVKSPDFAQQVLERLDKNRPVAVYCRSGNRSSMAVKTLVEKGFTKIYHLESGIKSWTGAGKETVR